MELHQAARPSVGMDRTRARASIDLIRLLANAQVIGGLCLITGLVVTFTTSTSGTPVGFEDRSAGSPIAQALGLLIYLPSLLFIVGRPDTPIRTVPRAWLLVLLQALIFASYFWAVEPGPSLRRAFALAIEMLFVWHIASWFEPRQFVRLLTITLMVMLVASVVAIAVPRMGITPSNLPHAGALRGVFPSKNVLGEAAGTAGVCFFVLGTIASKRRIRVAWYSMVLLAVFELLLANSRTPLLSMIGASAMVWCLSFIFFPKGWQQRVTLSLRVSLVSFAGLLMIVVLPAAFALILALLGRTLTLSGRTKLWQYATEKGWDRPWLGAGYKSFWTDTLTSDLQVLHQYWGLGVTGEKALTNNAHNGYLDIWLELGAAGALIFALLLVSYTSKMLRALQRTADPIYLWHMGMLGFVMIYYVTESGVIGYNELSWFVLAYGFVSLCAREAAERAHSIRNTVRTFGLPVRQSS